MNKLSSIAIIYKFLPSISDLIIYYLDFLENLDTQIIITNWFLLTMICHHR